MQKPLIFAGVAAMLSVAGTSAIADDRSSGDARAVTVRPNRGMSMHDVERRFGAPLRKLAPAGDPPISRWGYAEFTVYFEGKYVVHTVIAPTGP